MGTNKFIESQPKIWQDLYNLYNQHLDSEELLYNVTNVLLKYRFTQEQASTVAPQLIQIIDQNLNPSLAVLPSPEQLTPSDLTEDGAALAKSDITWLKCNLRSELNLNIVLFVTALAVFARTHPHKSNWIHYDKKEIIFLAGIFKMPVKDQESLSKEIHTKYQLNMQVVGSMQPIPCFQFLWQASSPITDDNPLVIISDYTPSSLLQFVLDNIYNLEKGE